MPELSEELTTELVQGILRDLEGMQSIISQMSIYSTVYQYKTEYAKLEQLAYITEQIRLKLKILGAPRLYN